MSTHRIHYAGEVYTKRSHGFAGWAACCSGSKAERIRAERWNTYEPAEVTCKACLRVMARATDRKGNPQPIR